MVSRIRDENWETVARMADLNTDMLSWEELQPAEDAAGNLLYPGDAGPERFHLS